MNFLAVFLGGGIGATIRYLISIITPKNLYNMPCHTLLANFLGCFLASIVATIFIYKSNLNPIYKTLLITGFCGGLSTLSAFSLETVNFLQNGSYFKAFSYITTSLLVCIASVLLGIFIVKKLLTL